MQTSFTAAQLADSDTAVSASQIRACVHCGFCTATCPTYVLLGDELDSPRGRIYLIKDMLENDRAPSAEVVEHIDRCLSCLSCMTTCPSGVNYMHLIDHARAYVEQRYRRPLRERLIRALLAFVLPYPGRLRLAMRLAPVGRLFSGLLDRFAATRPLSAMLALAPRSLPAGSSAPPPAPVRVRGRVALLKGCAEPVLRPEYRDAAYRVLHRVGYEVLPAPGEACCGALVHHLGRVEDGLAAARRNIDAWIALIEHEGLDAILVTASGCGTMLKDYGFLLRDDPQYAAKAARISAIVRDISEFLADVDLPDAPPRGLSVAYHPPCSLQHGQKVTEAPRRLLARAGYTVRLPADAHLCCGSAGTYNILQPEIAGQLGDRKAAALDGIDADVIASGNVGCAMQIGARARTPVVHVVELVDWATGGPAPAALAHLATRMNI